MSETKQSGILSNDGRVVKSFLIDSFSASTENFQKKVYESEQNLPSSYVLALFDEILQIKSWSRKPTELEAYLLSYVLDIKHDYVKALQHILQGFVSDHYFFVRRAVETAQYLSFLKSKVIEVSDFQKYLDLDTTDFKRSYKYRNWFKSIEAPYLEKYPVKMTAYHEACELGVHANKQRKTLVQRFQFSQDSFEVTSYFHDIDTKLFSYDMGPAFIFKLHEVFGEIFRFLYEEKVFAFHLNTESFQRYSKRLLEYKLSMHEHYLKIDPSLKHFF